MPSTNLTGLTLSQKQAILDGLQREFDDFSYNFTPLLSDRVKTGLLINSMNDFLDPISDFTPISSYVTKKARTKIQGMLTPPDEFSDLFQTAVYIPTTANAYFDSKRDNKGKPIVKFKGLNTSVGYFELGVMSFPTNWNALEGIAGLAATVINPSFDLLVDTNTSMEEFLTDPNKTTVQAHTKQIGWSVSLNRAKALLMGLTSEPPAGQPDAFRSAEAMAMANEKFDKIRDVITEQSLKDPHNDAWTTANSYLGNVAQGLSGQSSSHTAKALSGAQSVRLSLMAGLNEDRQLAGQCKAYMNAVEDLEGFQDMKDTFDKLFEQLGLSDIGAQLSGALQLGNLSALLAEAGIPEDLMDWLLACAFQSELSVDDIDDIIKKQIEKASKAIMEAMANVLQMPSFPQFAEWMKKKDELMKGLQDQLAMLNEMIAKIEDPKQLLKFTTYELEVEDPCSIDSLIEAINELIDQLVTETEETFDEIAASLGGNIVAILVMLLADFVIAELQQLIDQYGLDVLFGNAMKALLNSIAMIMVLLEGAKLYMQYLAVKALYNEVSVREELGVNLLSQYTALISVLQLMVEVGDNEKDAFAEIHESKKWVRKAKLTVGMEKGKILNNEMPSLTRLVHAQEHIAKALSALVPEEASGDSVNNLFILNDLLIEWNLKKSDGSSFMVLVFTGYVLRELAGSIQRRFFQLIDGEDYERFLVG